jgi:integrase
MCLGISLSRSEEKAVGVLSTAFPFSFGRFSMLVLHAVWTASRQLSTLGHHSSELESTELRRGQCAHIRSDHVRDKLLILPATLTKNRREYQLPLTPLALHLLQKPSGSYVFPGRRSSAFKRSPKAKTALDRLSGLPAGPLTPCRLR